MHVTAIIAAGGRGERFGGAGLKQLFEIGGRPILERSVTAFLEHSAIQEVIVAAPRELVDDPPAYLRAASKPLRVVGGGRRRRDSVANAFRAASDRTDLIVIHDAARPFVSADLITRTLAAAAECGAALAAIQARDTVKRASEPAEAGRYRDVVETLVRESIYLAQTPQAFRSNVLADALALDGEATDEAALAERAGYTVRIVEGEASNVKITTREDLAMAEAIERHRLGGEAERGVGARVERERGWVPGAIGVRAGIGYDLHRLVEGRPLVLGGVAVPFDRGLAGHSDADAVCHAIIDAILGAAGAGDIGGHFPDSDSTWKDASSLDLLGRAAGVVRAAGFEVGNVDVTVIAERPKLAPQIDAMRANLARALGISTDRVNVKGKTNEGIGELGRGEAIAVNAIALVRAL